MGLQPTRSGCCPAHTIFGFDARLIFVILLIILVFPSLFFLVQSYWQLGTILTNINTPVASETRLILQDSGKSGGDPAAEFAKARVALERDVMSHRHHRASTVLATRTWIYFMSLMFGAILVVIGAAFVLGRITVPASQGEFKFRELGASLTSSSPRLFLIAFGCVLVALPVLAQRTITIDDTSTYIEKTAANGFGAPATSLIRPQSVIDEIVEKALRNEGAKDAGVK